MGTEFKYDWSYIVAWIGVGLALIASILFSLAAVCIRTDKEREDAMNMQYLMPVYHQKQGYPYGPYGYAAYPGPYYGSQYGPYLLNTSHDRERHERTNNQKLPNGTEVLKRRSQC